MTPPTEQVEAGYLLHVAILTTGSSWQVSIGAIVVAIEMSKIMMKYLKRFLLWFVHIIANGVSHLVSISKTQNHYITKIIGILFFQAK